MEETELIERLNRYKKKIQAEIDDSFKRIISEIMNPASSAPYELPMTSSPSQFCGLKPCAIIYPNGRKETVRTWREVTEKLLKDCDAQMHEQLYNIVDDMQGRMRPIMAHSAEELDSPMRIGEGIYMECRYDTTNLIRLATQRIFSVIGYDYSEIKIRVI